MMILRLVLQTVLFVAFLGLVLFAAAGTLDWPGAWLFLEIFGGGSLLIGLWLAWRDPALLKERMSPIVQRRQALADRILMPIAGLLFLGWLVGMAFDARRYHLSNVPQWLGYAGAALVALCFLAVLLVFRANTFAAPVIKAQTERGQTIVSTGPYAIVRHPMYGSVLFFFAGTPLLLGSWYGLLILPLILVLLAVRVLIEERTLRREFADYADYARKVRFRLVPLVW
jgi:protein-S-isoprenylcysteine O-methyltransferase Ste14